MLRGGDTPLRGHNVTGHTVTGTRLCEQGTHCNGDIMLREKGTHTFEDICYGDEFYTVWGQILTTWGHCVTSWEQNVTGTL